MATYACLLLFFGLKDSIFELMTSFNSKVQITITVFTFTFILPSINIFIMYRLKRIKSITLSERSERSFPYFMTAIFYFGLYYLLYDIKVWETIKVFVFCAGSAILLTALINTKYKISAHMVGVGGITGVLISLSVILKSDFIYLILASIIVAGFVGWARIKLNEHNQGQVYLGYGLGLFCQLVLFMLLEKFVLNL